MRLPRRQFLQLAAAAAATPVSMHPLDLAHAAPNPVGLPAPTQAERGGMADLAQAFMQKYDVPALSLAIGRADSLLYEEAFGWADRERREAASQLHLFRIASVSKPITSIAIFSLIEAGRIRLSDRVFGPGAITGIDYGRPPYHPHIDEITLEHLFTHTGGGWSNERSDRFRALAHTGDAGRRPWRPVSGVLRARCLRLPFHQSESGTAVVCLGVRC
jgi:CubicO group peptidase (beta-lactamase class C family)